MNPTFMPDDKTIVMAMAFRQEGPMINAVITPNLDDAQEGEELVIGSILVSACALEPSLLADFERLMGNQVAVILKDMGAGDVDRVRVPATNQRTQ